MPNDNGSLLLSLLIGFLGTLLGSLPALVVMFASRSKLVKEANLADAEAKRIYDQLELDAAKRAHEREAALVAECKRLRQICREHGINPDKIDTGPLGRTPKAH